MCSAVSVAVFIDVANGDHESVSPLKNYTDGLCSQSISLSSNTETGHDNDHYYSGVCIIIGKGSMITQISLSSLVSKKGS